LSSTYASAAAEKPAGDALPADPSSAPDGNTGGGGSSGSGRSGGGGGGGGGGNNDAALAARFLAAPRNGQIKAARVLVIGPGDARPGVMALADALAYTEAATAAAEAEAAKAAAGDRADDASAAPPGYDLVLVAAASDPPVCRVLPCLSSKTVFEMRRRRPGGSSGSTAASGAGGGGGGGGGGVDHSRETKEVEVTAGIAPRDLQVKASKAAQLLGRGYRVQLAATEGRGQARGTGLGVLRRLVEAVGAAGVPRGEPSRAGPNRWVVVLVPAPTSSQPGAAASGAKKGGR
ncbi:hypothetical protein HK405_012767, partial [Cladochytrium tenue]